MKAESRLSRLLLVSPWPLLVFLVIPLLVIVSVTLNVRLFPLGPKPLLANNICFALVCGCRLLRYLVVLKRTVRYGATCCRPASGELLPQPLSEVRDSLAASGYRFDAGGCYGEKRDFGYLGTTLLYAGLFLVLAVGSWDNLRQFSGVIMDGMGPGTNLNKLDSYRSTVRGPLAAVPVSLPRMQIDNQILPDEAHPLGATSLALLGEDGKGEKLLLQPGARVAVGAYDLYMEKLVFEPEILIKRADTDKPLFYNVVQLNQLVQKRGVFSFYGPFQGYDVSGGVYYQPEKSNFLIVVSRGNAKVVSDLMFQVQQQVTQGDYVISCPKMGQWSEIHVVHRRHQGVLVFGALVALVGLLLRIAVRPQRVWLEETGTGCRKY